MPFPYSGQPLANNTDVMLTDLDGVAYVGKVAAPYAAESIARAVEVGVHPVYVTNNSSRPPRIVAEHLTKLGIPTSAKDVVNSSMTGAMQLAKHVEPGSKVLVVGGEGVWEAVRDAGFEAVDSADDDPVAILQGWGEQVGWRELSEVALAIRNGALYVATNLDATLPKERGLMIGSGSLVAAVVNATGVRPLTSGKPKPDMYELVVEMTGAQHPIAIGDRLDTDIVGANAAGIRSVHVLTGVGQVRDVILAAPQERPNALLRDLRDLHIEIPEVVRDGDVYICENARVTVVDGIVYVNDAPLGEEITYEAYLATAACVWGAVDANQDVDRDLIPAISLRPQSAKLMSAMMDWAAKFRGASMVWTFTKSGLFESH